MMADACTRELSLAERRSCKGWSMFLGMEIRYKVHFGSELLSLSLLLISLWYPSRKSELGHGESSQVWHGVGCK